MPTKTRILLGMSGGTDSSVAAILLQQAGYEVIGVTFRFYEHNSDQHYLEKAKNMADFLHIPHYVVDKREEFSHIVIQNFVDEYMAGRTPFPCVHCNMHVKWISLLEQAALLNCSYIATGHYANCIENQGITYITKGIDDSKDQTFFLWGMPDEAIQRVVFPLGSYRYKEVHALAKKHALPIVQGNKNSVGACFCPSDYRPFLKELAKAQNLPIKKGVFTDEIGEIIGSHQGYPFYTIGQRRGLGVQHTKPLYVQKIDKQSNIITLAEKTACYQSTIEVEQLIYRHESDLQQNLIAKIQYRKQASCCTLTLHNEHTATIVLHTPATGIAKGQSIVLYDNERLIGGGVVENAY